MNSWKTETLCFLCCEVHDALMQTDVDSSLSLKLSYSKHTQLPFLSDEQKKKMQTDNEDT